MSRARRALDGDFAVEIVAERSVCKLEAQSHDAPQLRAGGDADFRGSGFRRELHGLDQLELRRLVRSRGQEPECLRRATVAVARKCADF